MFSQMYCNFYWKSIIFSFRVEPKCCLSIERNTTRGFTLVVAIVNGTLIHVVSFVLFCCRHQS